MSGQKSDRGHGNRGDQRRRSDDRRQEQPKPAADSQPTRPLEREGFELTGQAGFVASPTEQGNGSPMAFMEWTRTIVYPNDRFGAAELVLRISIQQWDPCSKAIIYGFLQATGTPLMPVPVYRYVSWPGICQMLGDFESSLREDEKPTIVVCPEGESYPFAEEKTGQIERFVKRAMRREGWLKQRPEVPTPNAVVWHAMITPSITGQAQHFFKEVPSEAGQPELPDERVSWTTYVECVVEPDPGPPAKATTGGQTAQAAK